jgi:GNAT superfamily N-acetyltransferase
MIRRGQPSDADAIIATITSAFHNDPVWSWAFPDEQARPAQFTRWWQLFVEAALRDGWVWVTENCEAITMWMEPGVEELNDGDIAKIWPLLQEIIPDRAAVIAEMLQRFDDNHPHAEDHYYLSFVATHTDHRGQGIGVKLLEHNLALIDAEGLPAYLESSNPRNEPRYERLGWQSIGTFNAADDGPPLTQMWRTARSTT